MEISKEKFEQILQEAFDSGERATDGMRDGYPCGGAYLTARGNSTIVKLFKKYGTEHSDYLILNPNMEKPLNGDTWSARKEYPKGYAINDPIHSKRYQNMDMAIAEVSATALVLNSYGLEVSWRSYID